MSYTGTPQRAVHWHPVYHTKTNNALKALLFEPQRSQDNVAWLLIHTCEAVHVMSGLKSNLTFYQI